MRWLGFAVVLLGLTACNRVPAPDESVYAARDFAAQPDSLPCAQADPDRRALFGDLHVHTYLSSDAWNFGMRLKPTDAYRYAFGEAVGLPLGDQPFARQVAIDRPLDFAGVTDHAEFLGEQSLCLDPDTDAFETSFCEVMRRGEGRAPQLVVKIMSPFSTRDIDVCGEDGQRCVERSTAAWREIIDAAETWHDRSGDCTRSTLIGYEYSSFRMGSNLHRNVVFRNASVLARPVSYLETTREWDLWRILKEQCLDSDTDCDVMAIPHNANISNGRMFAVDYPGARSLDAQRARARLRQRIEPLAEIMQHKGDSECRNGLPGVLGAADELCDFEKFEDMVFRSTVGENDTVGECYSGPLADWVPHLGPSCLDRNSYLRYALATGLAEEQRLGVNPFKFGIMASTDTHNAMAGGVAEWNFPGHLGIGDATAQERVQFNAEIPGNASNNPGGLIGVWAEENSRDAIFDAMRRREVFGTSGPRILPRFFGGWSLPTDLCERPDMVRRAYATGVPMGSDLPAVAGEAPRFLVSAAADPGTADRPGIPLQRLQVIKLWADDEGNSWQRVYEVAGDRDNGASVDLATCETRGSGSAQLCSVWQDPEFDAAKPAVYYLRAVENPSCRYTAYQCLSLPDAERPTDCATPLFNPVIQERAWSSPIWYSPQGV